MLISSTSAIARANREVVCSNVFNWSVKKNLPCVVHRAPCCQCLQCRIPKYFRPCCEPSIYLWLFGCGPSPDPLRRTLSQKGDSAKCLEFLAFGQLTLSTGLAPDDSHCSVVRSILNQPMYFQIGFKLLAVNGKAGELTCNRECR